MGDIFDQAAQQAPSGDIFDQAAAAMQPQASFSQRIGERLKQNFDLPQQAENVRQAVNQALDPNNHKTDGFHDLWEGLKQTYKDPANMVADALSAYVGGQLHEAEPGAPKPAQAPSQAAPEGPSLTSRVMDAAQPRIQRAATRFLMKRIPGAHLAMDAMDFARDVAKAPEAPPAPPTPAAPTGPPEMWGKQIAAQEAPAPAPPARMTDAAPRNPAAQSIPRTLSGESALRQVLTGQDNANLMKIAKARGINVAKESQLKPGVADNLLIKKVIDDFSPDELQEFSDKYLENSRFSHKFGDIGPEAWKTLSLQTYFPELKLAGATLKRTQAAIQKAGQPAPPMSIALPAGQTEADLTPLLQESLKRIRAKKAQAAPSPQPAAARVASPPAPAPPVAQSFVKPQQWNDAFAAEYSRLTGKTMPDATIDRVRSQARLSFLPESGLLTIEDAKYIAQRLANPEANAAEWDAAKAKFDAARAR